jgi:hypothetical protein
MFFKKLFEPNKHKSIQKLECPYCFVPLLKLPSRKTKCTSCLMYMYVRTRPSDQKKVIVTKEGAEKIDQEWSIINGNYDKNNPEKIYELSWPRGEKLIVNSYSSLYKIIGITEQNLFDRRQKFKNVEDTIWSFCNEALLKNQKDENYENLIAIYNAMERIQISKNKSANYLAKRRLYYQLLKNKAVGYDIVIIVVPDTSCEECKKLDGKEFSIDEAIEKQILPPDNCSCLGCSCMY